MSNWTAAAIAQIRAPRAPRPTAGTTAARAATEPAEAKKQPSPAAVVREAAARREVVGVGRLAWTNTTFGFPLPCRKYLLADEAQAQQLDALFFTITGTQP